MKEEEEGESDEEKTYPSQNNSSDQDSVERKGII